MGTPDREEGDPDGGCGKSLSLQSKKSRAVVRAPGFLRA